MHSLAAIVDIRSGELSETVKFSVNILTILTTRYYPLDNIQWIFTSLSSKRKDSTSSLSCICCTWLACDIWQVRRNAIAERMGRISLFIELCGWAAWMSLFIEFLYWAFPLSLSNVPFHWISPMSLSIESPLSFFAEFLQHLHRASPPSLSTKAPQQSARKSIKPISKSD